jgi:hypothetical protein
MTEKNKLHLIASYENAHSVIIYDELFLRNDEFWFPIVGCDPSEVGQADLLLLLVVSLNSS